MLSDEEREALEILNNTEWDGFMITIKNLIKKQSKEIEELNRKVKIKEADIDIFMKKLNKAWIYKIKAKIEEYKKKCKNCNFRGKICEDLTKNYNCTIAVCLNEFYSLLNKEIGDK